MVQLVLHGLPALLARLGPGLAGLGGGAIAGLGALAATHGAQAVKTGIGTSVGLGVMESVRAVVMNADNAFVAATGAPVNPDSLESLLRITAGVIGPFAGGVVARSIGGGDSFMNRVVTGATFGAFIGQNLSNSLGAAANDFAGLEAMIRNHGIINGYKGVIPGGIADLAGKVANFVSPAIRNIAQYPSMHIPVLDQIPLIGNNTNLGSLVGIATYDFWPLIASFATLYGALTAVKTFAKTATTNTYFIDTAIYLGSYFVPKVVIPWLASSVNVGGPAVNMAADVAGVAAATVAGYLLAGRKTRGTRTTSDAERSRLRFTVAAGTGIMAANFLDVHFGQYLAGLGNYISSVQPALSQVKQWIPEMVGGAAGLLYEAYRQARVHGDQIPVVLQHGLKYLTPAAIGYVGADITWGNPVGNLVAAGAATGLCVVVDKLLYARAIKPVYARAIKPVLNKLFGQRAPATAGAAA